VLAAPNNPRAVIVDVWQRSEAQFAHFDSYTLRSSNLLSNIVADVGCDVKVGLWGLPACIILAVFTAQLHLLNSKDPRSVAGDIVIVFDNLPVS